VLEPHERALQLVGVPFRPQGRDPERGLDCIGVVVCAFRLQPPDVPRYQLIDGSWDQIVGELYRWFAAISVNDATAGDLAVFKLPRSFHFGVISGAHLIHADITVGKVVARRLPARLGKECRIFRYRGE
jgi:cell wall-associated NlpC family hydrolase